MSNRKQKAAAILGKLSEFNPDPATELNFSTPWQLLVATVLSAQSTDRQVNKVTARLFATYPGPHELALLTADEIAEEIKELGLFRNKSRHLAATARIITDKYGGQVPETMEELIELPGVGRKTANVILSNAFGIPALAVDTHVFRVSNRLGLAKGKTPLNVEQQLMSVIPREKWPRAHHWLILHGRYTCTARRPKCEICPVSSECEYLTSTKTGKSKQEEE